MILPEFIRQIDAKGRVTLPGILAPEFGDYARVFLTPTRRAVLIQPATRGARVTLCSPDCPTRRVTVPAEFRALTRLVPGAAAGMAMTEAGLMVWAVPVEVEL